MKAHQTREPRPQGGVDPRHQEEEQQRRPRRRNPGVDHRRREDKETGTPKNASPQGEHRTQPPDSEKERNQAGPRQPGMLRRADGQGHQIGAQHQGEGKRHPLARASSAPPPTPLFDQGCHAPSPVTEGQRICGFVTLRVIREEHRQRRVLSRPNPSRPPTEVLSGFPPPLP